MFLFWLILLGVLQVTILKDFNMLVILAVFSGLRKGAIVGLLMGCMVGIFVELVSGSAFGLNLALYSFIGFMSGVVRAHLYYYKESIFMQVMFSFCGVVLFYFLYFILTNRLYPSIFSTAFFSAVLSPLIFRIVGR